MCTSVPLPAPSLAVNVVESACKRKCKFVNALKLTSGIYLYNFSWSHTQPRPQVPVNVVTSQPRNVHHFSFL